MLAENRSETVAVAMSGGVDSSVAAALLVERGHRVIGVTAMLTQEYSRCCSDEDVERARQVAADLGFEHHLVDVRAQFKREIIDPFMREYLRGRTPSPCVICNPAIKFGALWEAARQLGATRLATGHYVEVRTDAQGLAHLWRGRDSAKDQSYFLARLRQAQLQRTVFPLAALRKTAVTRYAQEHQLACRASRESQDICFVTEGTHGAWIDLRSFETAGPGEIVDTAGRILGRHAGVHHYTVGQRKGLGLATGTPLYVVAIDPQSNRIIVGERAAVMTNAVTVDEVNWIAVGGGQAAFRATAQIRYKHAPAPCNLTPLGSERWRCEFDEPQFGAAPGQLAAFYQGDEVLGGGWICA